MRVYLDCIPCFFQQALRAGRMIDAPDGTIRELMNEIGAMLKEIPPTSTPPETGRFIYKKIGEITGNSDPYEEIKRANIDKALKMYPALKKIVDDSDDRLLTAARIAIAGNIIDFGVGKAFDIEDEVETILERDFAIFDYDKFKYHIDKADEVLYIGDNAGEAVFDRILIEEIKKPTTYIVRGKPVINDVTYGDAVRAGIESVATIFSSGTDTPGTILKFCSDEFKKLYDKSSFIISKGQGNYEGLSDEKKAIFFLLKVKCFVIAQDIGVQEGDIVLEGINI